MRRRFRFLTALTVVIKAPPTFTAEQFLSSIPLLTEYGPLRRPATSPAHGLTPQSVGKWSAFIPNARAYHFDDAIRLDRKPTFITSLVRNEAGISSVFNINVVETLHYFAGRTSFGASIRIFPEVPIRGSGIPNYSIMENNVRLFFIEIKTKACLDIADIVTEYNNQHTEARMPVIKAIRQVFGYMGDGKLRYGVLSTYERTWFLYRPDDSPGSLLISDCVERTATDPTLLHCFAYMMTLPRGGNHFSRTPPPSPAPSPPTHDDHEPSQEDEYNLETSYKPKNKPKNSSEGRKRKKSGKGRNSRTKKRCWGSPINHVKQFNWGDFDVTNELGYGRCGTVYEAIFRCEKVALKIVDSWKYPKIEDEMMNEASIYIFLEELQGVTIPKLKGFGYTAGGLFAIATEVAGSPVKLDDLSDEERNGAVKALASLHDHGVLHGDIRPDNVLVQYEHNKINVKLIDLAFSRRISNKNEAKKEMITLQRMLGF